MKWNKMRNLKRGKRFQLPLPFEFLLQQIVNLPQSLWYIWSNELMSIFDTVSDHFALVKMGALMQLNQMCHDWPNIFLTIFTLVSCQFALAKICRNTQLKYHLFKSYILVFIFFIVVVPKLSLCEIHLCQSELTNRECLTSMSNFCFSKISLRQRKMTYNGFLESKMTIRHGKIPLC